MKHETVTYDLVSKDIAGLASAGEKITIANVLKKSGGSAGKIAAFIKRWKSEQRLINAYSLSDQMLAAIIAENKLAVDRAIIDKDQEILDMRNLLSELQEINLQHEAKIEILEDLGKQFNASKEQIAILERQLKESREAESRIIAELSFATQKGNDATRLQEELKWQLLQAKKEEGRVKQELIAKSAKIEQLEKHVSDMYDKLRIK